MNLEDSIRRIQEMEREFNLLQELWEEEHILSKERLEKLVSYYENGQWLEDFQIDEQGLLPVDLKRGILSEDAFYNFLSEVEVPLE